MTPRVNQLASFFHHLIDNKTRYKKDDIFEYSEIK